MADQEGEGRSITEDETLVKVPDKHKYRDSVVEKPDKASEPRVIGEKVRFVKSATQTPTWTVAAVKQLPSGEQLGDSNRVYQLKMSDGNLYVEEEWVAQNRLLDK